MLAIEEEIFQASIARGVLLVKGTFFRADNPPSTDTVGAGEMFFRTTFAAVDEEKIVEGIRRFGEALRDVFGL